MPGVPIKSRAYPIESKRDLSGLTPMSIKQFDQKVAFTPFATAPTAILLNAMVQGGGSNNYTGRVAEMLRIRVLGAIGVAASTNVIKTCVCRIVIAWVFGNNETAPVYTDLILDSFQATYVLAPLNAEINKQAHILWDETRMFGPKNVDVNGNSNPSINIDPIGSSYLVDLDLDVPNLPTVWTDGTGGIAKIAVGSIVMFLYTDNVGYGLEFGSSCEFI